MRCPWNWAWTKEWPRIWLRPLPSLAGMHESFVAGFFLDGVEGVCAVVQVCCVPKWFVVSHVFLVWGCGSLWSAYRNVELRVTDQNGVTTVTCRFTHYFFKNGNKYYFQIIWTHYCIIWHQMSLTGRIFTNAHWQAVKLESCASKATKYLILLTIYSPWLFSSWLFEGGNIHVGQNFIKNDTHTAYVKPMNLLFDSLRYLLLSTAAAFSACHWHVI